MSIKKVWKNLLDWLKEYKEELAFFLIAVGLTLSIQLVGCNEVAFHYQPPTSCADFDIGDLEDAECDTPDSNEIDWAGPDGPGGIRQVVPGADGPDSSVPATTTSSPSQPPSRPSGPSLIRFSNTYNMGIVDIIFVIDNSRSMHVEHTNIANQFDQFLDDIRYLDYRIAMMTVDISDSPNNKDRTYQDGYFIEFKRGQKYLSNADRSSSQHDENIRLFKSAVKRPESIECMQAGKADECPDDERAICALNKSLDISSQRDFFRKTAHLMVIILSDEDERSSEEYRRQQWQLNRIDYRLTGCDDPRNFYSRVSQRIGLHTGISVHAIIIPPGDERCLQEQDDELGKGYYGELYERFADPDGSVLREFPYITPGQVLSICDRSFGAQLGRLSDYLQEPLPITLPCEPYRVQNVQLVDGGSSENVRYELNGKNLTILEDQVSLSSRVRVDIFCTAGE
ncbi:MAG: hypothetical protein OXK80_01500 [Bdellovibrionales bacterium]|nr:hypothetical protein [Bdellovibrionales bacterium]